MKIEDILKKYNSLSIKDLVEILEFITKSPKEKIFSSPDLTLNQIQFNLLEGIIKRYKKDEPLASILGYKYFYENKFIVNPHVLIPRPETEILVNKVIGEIIRSDNNMLDILEVGVGTGCISISVLKKVTNQKYNKNVTITATDISTKALRIAKKNAKNILLPKTQKSLKLVKADILPKDEKKFNIIISNPPYIPSHLIPTLAKSVQGYEPALALDGGKNGIDIYKKIISHSKYHMAKDAIFLFEVDEVSLQPLEKYLNKENLQFEISNDLAGKPRILKVSMRD